MGKQSRDKWQKRNEINGEGAGTLTPRLGLEKTCLFIIRWSAYLVLFAPLIVNTQFFFPFVAPKTIFFRMVVEIILAAYIFLVMKNRIYRPRISALTVALALFVGI